MATSVYWKSEKSSNFIATIATTLGILGTFGGVFLGLLGFNENDIAGSVPDLLAGLKAAFLTSIVGMIVSIIVKLTREPPRKPQSREERNRDNTVTEMVTYLKKIHAGISGDSETSLVTQTAELKQSNAMYLHQLNTTLEAFSEKMVADSTQSLVDALTQVMRDFNAKINEQFGENFKHLNEGIGRMLTWQQAYHQQISEMNEQYQRALTGISACEEILQSLSSSAMVYQHSATKLDKLLDHLGTGLTGIEALAANAHEAFPTIERKITELTTHFTDAVEVATRENSRMMETQREMIDKNVSTLHESYEDVRQQQHKLVDELNSQYIKSMSERYEATSKQMKAFDEELGNELNKALESMGSQLTSLSSKFVEDYEPLTEALRKLVQSSKSITNGVS
ncbi:MAG: hypothetical protein WA960_01575 [Tunicatimonas sp.]